MKPRLLIIGASGFVGSRWAQTAAERFEVTCAARHPLDEPGWLAIDITTAESVRAAFDEAQPEWVTLLAALSDIDRCQREPALAETINVDGAVHVAAECARRGARLLYTSTDAVFDGTKAPYSEDDPPTPPNWYGQTKARAERAIAQRLPSATIVRPSLVLGTSAYGVGNSYLEKVIANLHAGNPIISPTYEYRNPIDVGTLCEYFAELAQLDGRGIFQVGASDKISRYDLARAIAEQLGCDPLLIVPQIDPVPGRAPRGVDDFLATDRLRSVCGTPVPTCRQVIERALHAVA
jgi:dTDP-4-dehydrorhamnose reductase